MIFFKLIFGFLTLVSLVFFLLGLRSQKGSAPGLKNGQLSPCSSRPNCVSSESETQPEKKIDPFSGSLQEVKQAILDTGGTITAETDSYISAAYMTKIFKFVDDVELRQSSDGLVHIRSASRVGFSDRGINRTRVRAIRLALKNKNGKTK